MDGTNSLPDDLTECQELLLAAYRQSVQLEKKVAASQQEVAELNRVLDETAASFEDLKQEHAAALDELAWHKRWAFGRRRERFTEGEGQGHLFDLDPPAIDEPEDSITPDEEAEAEVKGHRRRKRRKIDWDKLRQIHHEHDLSDEEKVCSCCGRTMDRIGEDVTRELEYEPAKLEAHIHTRPKYACRRCKDGVSAAPLPPRTIPGGIAGPSLITEVFVGKFGDHLPLHRLEDILARYGVYISRSTMSGWMKAVAELLRPLYDLQRKLALQSSLMWTDDTPITVLGGPKGSFRGHFWVYIGDKEHPYSVYDFTNSHSRDGPARFLQSYSGYLHADAYLGYDSIFSAPGSSIIEVACWSHTRSRFFKAVSSNPRETHQVLEWVRQLYDIEDRAHDWSVDVRRDLLLRLNAADPCLEEMLPDRWAAAHPDAILTHRLEESRTRAVRTRARRAHRRARQK